MKATMMLVAAGLLLAGCVAVTGPPGEVGDVGFVLGGPYGLGGPDFAPEHVDHDHPDRYGGHRRVDSEGGRGGGGRGGGGRGGGGRGGGRR